MRARVYDRLHNLYYISEVYGILNRAGDWYIVDHPSDKQQVILVEYLNMNTPAPYEVNVEIIDANPFKSETWLFLGQSAMAEINIRRRNSHPLHCFHGFASIWNAGDALISLLETGSADKASLAVPELSTKLSGWHYIENNDDIDALTELYSGFHDAVIKEMSYISGEYYDAGQKTMYLKPAGSKQVKVVFNNDRAEELEMILLAPRIVRFTPGEENGLSTLTGASIILKDQIVYFYDSDTDTAEETDQGIYFKSMGLMWRIKPVSE